MKLNSIQRHSYLSRLDDWRRHENIPPTASSTPPPPTKPPTFGPPQPLPHRRQVQHQPQCCTPALCSFFLLLLFLLRRIVLKSIASDESGKTLLRAYPGRCLLCRRRSPLPNPRSTCKCAKMIRGNGGAGKRRRCKHMVVPPVNHRLTW